MKAIERIEMPSRAEFFTNFVARRQPVIITNFLRGQPLAAIDSVEAAVAAFGEVMLNVQTEYSSKAAGRTPPVNRTMTFRDYLSYADAQSGTRVMCTEYPTPARLSAQYRLPEVCRASPAELARKEILDLPKRWGDHDLLSFMFLGNRGNYAHTHYDGDQRQVILYQVFGRKRVVLFQPESGTKLDALGSFSPGFCSTYLQDMSDAQRNAFIEAADGYEAVLEPGEAVFMPMLIWHHLQYLDTALSINFRFGRNPLGRFLCVDNFHRDYYVQNVSVKLGTDAQSDPECQGALREIQATLLHSFDDRRAKIRQMRTVFKRWCSILCPAARAEQYCPPEREEEDIARIERDIGASTRYLPGLSIVSQQRPVIALTSVQKRVLQEALGRLAYPPGVFESILYNRFAKTAMDQLTATEGALLIRDLASPGAAW